MQSRLAAELGVSAQSLSAYERGVSRVPDEVAARLARIWNLRESEVRRELNLYVPSDLAGSASVVPHVPLQPDVVRLPKGIKLEDLEPIERETLLKLVDTYLDSILRDR